MGLRLRLFFVLIVPLIVLVGLYAVVRIREEEGQLLAAEQRNAAVTARAIQVAVENAVRDRQIADIRRLLSELVNRQEQIDRIRIYDKSLVSTLESEPGAVGGPVAAERLQRVMTEGRSEIVAEEVGNADTFSHVMPLRGRRGEIIGALEVLFTSPGAREKRERATRDAVIRLSLLALGLVTVTTVVLSRQVLRPLSQLTRSIRALGEGQPGPPLPVQRQDEMGQVAEAFNRMAEQLQAASSASSWRAIARSISSSSSGEPRPSRWRASSRRASPMRSARPSTSSPAARRSSCAGCPPIIRAGLISR
jgi:HAMP domain-containing protein